MAAQRKPELGKMEPGENKMDMRVTSQEGISLLKKFEGCMLDAYLCSAGVPTIAYGRTKDVTMGDTCTQEEAEMWLEEELQEYEGYVNEMVTVPLEQCEFDALVCWTYNLGPNNLRSSTLLKVLNEGKKNEVPAQMRRWNKAGGEVLQGLVRRREAESLLWQGEAWYDI